MAFRWKPAAALMVIFMLSCGDEPTPGRDLLLSASFEASAVGQPPAPNGQNAELPGPPQDDKIAVFETIGSVRVSAQNTIAGRHSLEFIGRRPAVPPPPLDAQTPWPRATFIPIGRQAGSSLRIAWRGRSQGFGIGYQIKDRDNGTVYLSGSG